MATFTKEQRDAIFTHDKNIVVVAGAGSGKTRVLVERYLTLLEQNPSWALNAVVAITFTREAALEMRNRVRQELESRLQASETDDARALWARHLSEMDAARIDTIHGLCADILRANAAEAGIDPKFEVLEPIEAVSLLSDVIDLVLRQLVEDAEDDTAILFTEYDMRQVRDVLMNQDLLGATFADVPASADELFAWWQAQWEASYRNAVELLKNDSEFVAATNFAPNGGFPEDDKLTDVWIEVRKGLHQLWSNYVSFSWLAVEKILAAINLRGGSAKKWGSKEAVATAKDYLKYIREKLQALLKATGEPPAQTDKRAAEMTLRWYQLVLRVQEAYRQAKHAESYLDFNDLEVQTAKLLVNNADVRARYQGNEFKRLLVDEFQDTNDAQWHIVQHLVDLKNDDALFVVGDMKQSIYGFRGADVKVFGDVRRAISNLSNGIELPLSVSFRSHPALIEAFNTLFERILTRDESSPVAPYEITFDQEMSAFRESLPDAIDQYSAIELLLLRQKQDDYKVTADERRLWEAHEIAQRILHFKREGAFIFDKDSHEYREFSYGDVAVLFQSTTHITTYEEVFKFYGLPFVTVAGRGYYSRQEVWDVLNLLKALHNPADNLSLAAALRSPMFGFTDEMLLALRLIPDPNNERHVMPLWDALSADDIPHVNDDDLQRIHFARDILHQLRQFAGRVTISELLRQALNKTGYLAALTGLPGGARLRRNVEKLIDIAEASGKITLGAFAHYLDDLTAREVREGEATLDTANAMRLMTVHASKGLEFPIVILADASWSGGRPDIDPLTLDKETGQLVCKIYDDDEHKLVSSYAHQRASYLQSLKDDAERKRLLYVAATRARDCLIISGELRERSKTGEWYGQGWMGTVLETLNATAHQDIADGGTYAYTDNASVRVWLPDYDPDLPQTLRSQEALTDWQDLQVTIQTETPSRLQKLDVQQEQMLGHINATQLADIGGYHHASQDEERFYYRQSVQRQIFDDAPAQIRDAMPIRAPRVRSRHIGEVVHEALRYWRFPDNTENLEQVLRSYAWQQRITDPNDVTEVVKRAYQILDRFQHSSRLYQQIQAVREAKNPMYSELPFIFRTEKRIIHGVIDLLFQDLEGNWVVLDYKTSYIHNIASDPQRYTVEHARRFHLQMGAYASAVRQELGGIIPQVKIHYIQYNQTVTIPTDVWQSEIQQLETIIVELIGKSS